MDYFSDLGGAGYSEEELLKLKRLFNDQLPESYYEFLKKSGKLYGNKEPEWFNFPVEGKHKEIQLAAQGIINISKRNYKLKETDFVFYYQELYRFAYFNILEGDNPPVYGFRLGQLKQDPILINSKFSDFIRRFRNHSEMFSDRVMIDMILLKDVYRKMDSPNFDYGQFVLKKENIDIPEIIKSRIEREFNKIEQEMIHKMIIDIVVEKSDYENDIFESIHALLNIVNGDFEKFQQKYLSQMIHQHSTPQWWIDENIKNVD